MRVVTRLSRPALAFTAGLVIAATLSALLALAQDFPPDPLRGRRIFDRHCAVCHGASGWGDGPQAVRLNTLPANFHNPLSFLKSDEDLLRTIEHGVVYSPMHSWRGRLSDAEMQDVLAYIRQLSQEGR